ncbi:hypothetical protein DSO57_1021621 [Entomophthora muscae]|uniref:Uncharacterized protein n=1 Tax=Entomophthora muscae TaxID=34485 RepID=A0ACC2S5K6_9FUNG|nr:hypothetical protein DSO57_1021621 [Entomophthora muscae]
MDYNTSQESNDDPDALIEPLSTSDTLSSTLQPPLPIEASSSRVSLKSPCQDEEEEEQVFPKKVKSNSHSTLAEAKAPFTKQAALIELSSTSDIPTSKLQIASSIEATSSSVFFKSSFQDEEEEEKILLKKAKSNNCEILTKTQTKSTNISAIP